mgnify:CR=1 FL=1
MKIILIPFAWLLRTLYQVFGNYGVALILFSLITKLILLPFNAKSKKSMMKTSRLGPKLKELEKKYGDDKLKYQQEVSNLYKKENVRRMPVVAAASDPADGAVLCYPSAHDLSHAAVCGSDHTDL